MPELLLTVEQAAERLQLHPDSVRRQLKRGTMRGIKRGTRWRVPESAIEESTPPELQRDYSQRRSPEAPIGDTPEARAKVILEGLHSDDAATRNATIVALSQADDETSRIVEEAAARAVEAWQGEEDDLSDWRALDSEPFHFPEEAPDYLTGLYRSDAEGEETAA